MITSRNRFVQLQTQVLLCWTFFMLMAAVGCSQKTKDQYIKADLASKAEGQLDFAAVNFTVTDGIVTLTGKCSSEKSKKGAEQTAKNINTVKGIIDKIVIAPVIINADFPLKQAADSVLKNYPTIKAEINSGEIVLEGNTQKEDVAKLLPALNNLHFNRIDNQLKLE